MADKDWDRETFFLYKHNPWVNRQSQIKSHEGLPIEKKEGTDAPIVISGETIRFEESMISVDHDVVKIGCHTHRLGVAAEYIWINRKYPNSTRKRQALTTLQLITGDKEVSDVYFDVIDLELEDGRKKVIYFDISEFFTGKGTSEVTRSAFMAEKLRRMYQAKGARRHTPTDSEPSDAPK